MMVDAIQQTRPERVGLWRGHGIGTTRPIGHRLVSRFGLLGGFQQWSSAIVCWAMGGYGLGLTGTLKTNTKEDMAANSRTIVLWGATLASQPDLAPALVEARKHSAYAIQIDTRRTETSRHADEVLLLRPGSDAALALALAQVILAEGLHDQQFIERYTLGFAPFAAHVQTCTPEWAAAITGLEPERIRDLARRYATQTPAVIVLGGSSI
jgi:anaerobic selenocysteine-containing dehydrogenase